MLPLLAFIWAYKCDGREERSTVNPVLKSGVRNRTGSGEQISANHISGMSVTEVIRRSANGAVDVVAFIINIDTTAHARDGMAPLLTAKAAGTCVGGVIGDVFGTSAGEVAVVLGNPDHHRVIAFNCRIPAVSESPTQTQLEQARMLFEERLQFAPEPNETGGPTFEMDAYENEIVCFCVDD